MKDAIHELLSVRCPAGIISPPEDTTLLLRDYEGARVWSVYEHGTRVQSERAFCGHTSLHVTGVHLHLLKQENRDNRPIVLNTNPWVGRYSENVLTSVEAAFVIMWIW